MTCLEGTLAKAEPKKMRYRDLHTADVLADPASECSGDAQRRVGTGMIDAAALLQSLQGRPDFVDALLAEVARRLAEDEKGVVTPAKSDQAA